MALHRGVVERRDGGKGDGSPLLQLDDEPADAVGEDAGYGLEVLVVDVESVEVVEGDEGGEGVDGVGDLGIASDGGEVSGLGVDGVAAEAEGELGVGVEGFGGEDGGGGEIGGVPEGCEAAVGGEVVSGRGRGLAVVDGEGEDEVEIDRRVDWNVGKLDAHELCADVFLEQPPQSLRFSTSASFNPQSTPKLKLRTDVSQE